LDDLRPVDLGCVVDKVALRYISLRVLRFFLVIIPPMLRACISLIYHRRYIILAVTASLNKTAVFLNVGLRHQDVEFRYNTSIASCTYPTSVECSVVTLRLILGRCIDTPECWVSIVTIQHICSIHRCVGGLHIKQKVLLGNLKREVFVFCEDKQSSSTVPQTYEITL
jgi:hypothetical protein